MSTRKDQIITIFNALQVGTAWGFLYSFPIYFPDLKNSFEFSQTQLDTIGASIYIGASLLGFAFPVFCLPALGFVGSWIFCWIGTLFAYIMIYLSYEDYINSNITRYYAYSVYLSLGSFEAMVIYSMILGFATGAVNPPTIELSLHFINEQYHDAFKSVFFVFYALGGTVSTLIYMYLIPHQTGAFLLFLIISYAISGLLALLSFAYLSKRKKTIQELKMRTEKRPLILEIHSEDGYHTAEPPQPVSTYSFLQVLFVLIGNTRSWLIFTYITIALGLGATFTTTLGNVAESLGGSQEYIAWITLIFTVSQTVGRLLLAVLFAKFKFPKETVLLSIGCVYFVTYMIAYFKATHLSLYFIVALLGFVYGPMWTMTSFVPQWTPIPDIVHFAKVYGIVCSPSITIGSLGLNIIAGMIYDRQAVDGLCIGANCFETTFLISFVFGLILMALSVALYIASRREARSSKAVDPTPDDDN